MYTSSNFICYTRNCAQNILYQYVLPESDLKFREREKKSFLWFVGFLLIITSWHSVVVRLEMNHTTVYTKRNHLGVTAD